MLLAFTIGQCVLALTAYFTPSWKILIIVSTVSYFLVLVGYFLIPESIHCLGVQGKMDELHATFKKIAEWNKTKFPEYVLIECCELNLLDKVNPLDLFKTKKLFISNCVQMHAWFSIFLLYFGLSLGADNLKGSVYLNFVLVSLIELPAILSTTYFPDRFGRKKTAISSIFIRSFTCITVAFYQQILSIAIIGKFFVSVSMYTIFSWSAELRRGNGVSKYICSCWLCCVINRFLF